MFICQQQLYFNPVMGIPTIVGTLPAYIYVCIRNAEKRDFSMLYRQNVENLDSASSSQTNQQKKKTGYGLKCFSGICMFCLRLYTIYAALWAVGRIYGYM